MDNMGTLLFYLLTFLIVSSLTSLAYRYKSAKSRYFLLFLSILFLSVVAGIRYEVGTDWLQYYEGPQRVLIDGIRGTKGDYEIGYVILARIIGFLGLSGTSFLFIYAFLTNLFFFMIINKYASKINVFATTFMYCTIYYLVSFNITRQYLSICIAMYAIANMNLSNRNYGNFIANWIIVLKENKKYLFYIFISTLFHKASIFCILALPLCYLMIRKKHMKLIVLLIVAYVVQNFKMLMNIAIKIMGSRDFQWYFLANIGGDGSLLIYILKYLPFLIIIWLSKAKLDLDDEMKKIENITLIGLVINSISLVIATDIERVCFPFLYFIIILTGFGMNQSNSGTLVLNRKLRLSLSSQKILNLCLYLFMIWTMWYIFFVQGIHEVVPYNTIF